MEPKNLLEPREAAHLMKCSETHLRKLAREKRIPHFQLSERVIRFDRDELLKAIRHEAELKEAEDA